MRIHCLQHAPSEGPSGIAEWAESRGHSVTISRQDLANPLPEIDTFDLLLLMGGPMNVYMDRDFPWLREERKFLADALNRGRSAIGVCLGAQFLADALGGRVTQNPEREIGWHPVAFTEAARNLVSSLPESQPLLHWHGDTFELPAASVHLAKSAACENQAFLHDGRILGLQFHPEMTRSAVAQLLAEDSPLPGGAWVQSEAEILGVTDKVYADARSLLDRLLDSVFG